MQNLKNYYSKIKSFEHLQSEVKKAKETFEVKPFVKEFYNIKSIISFARPLLSIFSIITGLGCLYYQFVTTFGIFFACFLSIALLLFIELVKNELGLLTFKRLYAGAFNSLNLVLVLFLACFFGLSVFLSVQGAKDIYKSLDTQTQKFTNNAQIKKDSLAKYYDTQIKNEKKELENFKNAVSYQGKINIYDKTTSNTIDKHTQNISNLQSQKSKELDKFNNAKAKNEIELNNEISFNVWFWLVLSLLVECFIILSLWFVTWFAWCVSLESEIMNNENFVFTQNDLHNYFNHRISNLVGNDLHQSNNNTKETLLIENKINELNKQVNELSQKISNDNDNTKNDIGFTIFKPKNNDTQNNDNDNRLTKIVTSKINEINNDTQKHSNDNRYTIGTCANCNKSFTKNHKKQIYCTENCRVQAWQVRTGKTLRKGKKT